MILNISKIVYFLIIFLSFDCNLFSQNIERFVFSSAGNSNAISSLILQSNIGELQIGTFSNSSYLLTQGFLQNNPVSVGLNDSELEPIVSNFFPNPVSSDLYIEFIDAGLNDFVVEVFDILGSEQKKTFEMNVLDRKLIFHFNLTNYNSGLYFVKIGSSKKEYNKTFKITKI